MRLETDARAVLREAGAKPWRVGSPVFLCVNRHDGMRGHPGSPHCQYTFQGWAGDDDAPTERYFSCFVSQTDPPTELIGSTGYGPVLSHQQAVAIVLAVNTFAAARHALRLYLTTYADTQTHPTATQECDVVLAVRAALAAMENE
jgi:hypothetical protein